MSIFDKPSIRRIYSNARIQTRAERELAISVEISRLNATDFLKLVLQSHTGYEELSEVPEEEFDLATAICWRLINELRDNGGHVSH